MGKVDKIIGLAELVLISLLGGLSGGLIVAHDISIFAGMVAGITIFSGAMAFALWFLRKVWMLFDY